MEETPQESHVKIERFNRTLRVELTADDVAKRADRCAHLVAERDKKAEEKKTATAHITTRIKEIEAEQRSLATEVRDKARYTEVDCERRYNYRLGKVTEVRLDTGVEISERAMTGAERQLENGLKGKPKNGGAEEAPELPTQKKRGGKGKGKKSGEAN
jgi:hypothetical protein